MEAERATNITNKHGKKKIIHPLSSLSIGGEGGIAGLLVFGGALAIAGFMAVASFASNANKGKEKGTHDHQPKPKPKPQQLSLDDDGCKSEEDHKATQSLSSLQHSTTQDRGEACCWTSNLSMNQEENFDPKEESPICFHHQEIVFSDHSHPESAASSNENGVTEECLVSLFNSPSGQAQELDSDEPQDGLKSTETETETDDDDDDMDKDDDVDVKSDDVLESGEEDSSKATGSSSLDYNEEPVWPAELIQETQEDFKGDYCDADDEAMTVTKEETLNEKASFSVVLKDQPSVLRTWVIPMLLLALLLLLIPLTRHPQDQYVEDFS